LAAGAAFTTGAIGIRTSARCRRSQARADFFGCFLRANDGMDFDVNEVAPIRHPSWILCVPPSGLVLRARTLPLEARLFLVFITSERRQAKSAALGLAESMDPCITGKGKADARRSPRA